MVEGVRATWSETVRRLPRRRAPHYPPLPLRAHLVSRTSEQRLGIPASAKAHCVDVVSAAPQRMAAHESEAADVVHVDRAATRRDHVHAVAIAHRFVAVEGRLRLHPPQHIAGRQRNLATTVLLSKVPPITRPLHERTSMNSDSRKGGPVPGVARVTRDRPWSAAKAPRKRESRSWRARGDGGRCAWTRVAPCAGVQQPLREGARC